MDTPFMNVTAALLAERDIATLRFEFAYMAGRRSGGPRKPPPKAERLVEEYRAAVAAALAEAEKGAAEGSARLVVGGKSMGGRVASLIAGELHASGRIAGLVCLGYPFHPPGKPEQLRTAHLKDLTCPTLIVQGERDPFGSCAEAEALAAVGSFAPAIRFHWAGDGDHDLGPRGGSGFTRKGNLAAAAAAVAAWCRTL
jgi:predicted alpha/beta-hydrolase family hydrolase